jgi:urate oxidase
VSFQPLIRLIHQFLSMKINLIQDSYGKSAIRLAKVTRHKDGHDFKEIHVNIQLEGDFETVYTEGSNKNVLPTDTMKNTVFALAKDHDLATIEDFGLHLTDHFLSNNPQVSAVTIDLAQVRWERMTNGETIEPYTYINGGNEQQTTTVRRTRDGIKVSSGLRGVRILKTTKSGFEGYIVEQFTTLPPTADRILATEMEAVWQYENPQSLDYQKLRTLIRGELLMTFANHHSYSVQESLYLMGESVLKNVEEVIEINFKLPNLHYLPINLKPFGMENHNDVFVASGDAFGYITGTLRREI